MLNFIILLITNNQRYIKFIKNFRKLIIVFEYDYKKNLNIERKIKYSKKYIFN